MITKIVKNTLATPADSDATLVNPNTAAISAITRNNIVQDNISRSIMPADKKLTLAVSDKRRKPPKDGRRVNYDRSFARQFF